MGNDESEGTSKADDTFIDGAQMSPISSRSQQFSVDEHILSEIQVSFADSLSFYLIFIW